MIMTKKLIFLNVLLITVLIGFQYFFVLESQTEPPSEEWSRSFPIHGTEGDYSKVISMPTETGFGISLLNFKKLDFLDCSNDLECTKKWTNSKLNPYKNTWSDGITTYFIQDDSLVRSTANQDDRIISSNVENFKKSGDTLVYWLTNQEVVIQQDEQPPVSFIPEYPVYTSIIVDERIFILTYNMQDNRYAVIDGTNDYKELFQFNLSSSENLSSMQIESGDDDQFSLLIDTEILSGGKRTKVIRSSTFNLTDNQSPVLSKLEFADKESGAKLLDIRSPVLFTDEDDTKITFSAYMYDQEGDKAIKIFVGSLDSSLVKAAAITKKGDLFVQPVPIDAKTIAYFKLKGKEKSLMYSSSTDEKRLQSEEVLEGDYKQTFFSVFTLLVNGVVLVLLSFTWLLPALGIVYLTLIGLQKLRKPYAFQVAFYMNTIVLILSQLLIFSSIFHPERIIASAPYLSEVWHVYLVIVIAGISSLLPVFLTRTKVSDDNFNQLLLYTTLMNLLFLFFILGPYFI